MWAQCNNVKTHRAFFYGKEEHNKGIGKCCKPVSETQARRATALYALRGKADGVRIWGCYAPGLACAECLREQGKGLWVTTNEPPRPLDELFPSTPEPGQGQSEQETGSSGRRSRSTRRKAATRKRGRKK